VGYLSISEFTQRTLADVEVAIDELKREIGARGAAEAGGVDGRRSGVGGVTDWSGQHQHQQQQQEKGQQQQQQQQLRALVIDLRGNLGGTLPSALDAASLFLPRGKVLMQMKSGAYAPTPPPAPQPVHPAPQLAASTLHNTTHAHAQAPVQVQGSPLNRVHRLGAAIRPLGSLGKLFRWGLLHLPRAHARIDRYHSTNRHADTTTPLLVLVDTQTASASEIFVAALLDHRRAACMGTNTLGKNVAQAIMTLSDGSGLAFTIREYLSPLGKLVWLTVAMMRIVFASILYLMSLLVVFLYRMPRYGFPLV
jgi:C-terminal processing protease CtpA/Prc